MPAGGSSVIPTDVLATMGYDDANAAVQKVVQNDTENWSNFGVVFKHLFDQLLRVKT